MIDLKNCIISTGHIWYGRGVQKCVACTSTRERVGDVYVMHYPIYKQGKYIPGVEISLVHQQDLKLYYIGGRIEQ